jgi:hypothetical protein
VFCVAIIPHASGFRCLEEPTEAHKSQNQLEREEQTQEKSEDTPVGKEHIQVIKLQNSDYQEAHHCDEWPQVKPQGA